MGSYVQPLWAPTPRQAATATCPIHVLKGLCWWVGGWVGGERRPQGLGLPEQTRGCCLHPCAREHGGKDASTPQLLEVARSINPALIQNKATTAKNRKN